MRTEEKLIIVEQAMDAQIANNREVDGGVTRDITVVFDLVDSSEFDKILRHFYNLNEGNQQLLYALLSVYGLLPDSVIITPHINGK